MGSTRQPDGNLLGGIPSHGDQELVERLAGNEAFRLERIVSWGNVSPEGFWYDQPEAEWVLLVQGAARLQFDGAASLLPLEAGDFLLIPAHTRHRVAWTSREPPAVWLALHFFAEGTNPDDRAGHGDSAGP